MSNLVRATDVTAVLHQYGAHRTLTGMLTSAEVRTLADEYRAEFEADGGPLADALTVLAVRAETRAVIDKYIASDVLPADQHHFDVSCDDRPYCEIREHHALEDMS